MRLQAQSERRRSWKYKIFHVTLNITALPLISAELLHSIEECLNVFKRAHRRNITAAWQSRSSGIQQAFHKLKCFFTDLFRVSWRIVPAGSMFPMIILSDGNAFNVVSISMAFPKLYASASISFTLLIRGSIFPQLWYITTKFSSSTASRILLHKVWKTRRSGLEKEVLLPALP